LTRRSDRGEVTATVLMVPVVLLTVMFVLQFGLAYYARQVVAGAAQDGAAAGARQSSSPGVGSALADQLIAEAGGSLFESFGSSAATDGDVVTVTSSGEVVSLLPFFGTITVSAKAAAHMERFEPQGGP
jgi:Flp pilus assembly protein TadG